MVTSEDIFPYIFAPVIVFILQYIITKFLEKKKKKTWLHFLRRSNDKINECLSKLEKIESTELPSLIQFSMPILIFLGYSLIIIIIVVINLWLNNIYFSLALAILIISFSVLLLVSILWKYTNDKNKKGEILNKADFIAKIFRIIRTFSFYIFSMIIPFIYAIFFASKKTPTYDIKDIRSYSFISILLIIAAIFLLINFRKFFFGRVKFEINRLYMRDFPIIHISANGGTLDGKIRFIFDENLIILDDNGSMKATEWDDVSIITIQKQDIIT